VVPQRQLCTAISAIPTANVQQLSNQLSQSAAWTFQWPTPVPLPLGFTTQCVVIKRDNMAKHESRRCLIHKNGSALTTTLLSKFLAITPAPPAAQRSYFSACWVQREDSHGPWIFPGMRLDPSSGVLSDWLSLASDRHQFPLAAATITHTHTHQSKFQVSCIIWFSLESLHPPVWNRMFADNGFFFSGCVPFHSPNQ